MNSKKFEDLNISSEILSAVKDMGFEEASNIQALSIPALLEGKDIIAKSQTGTGKTAAFAIPMLEKLDYSDRNLQAIILCPTRELVVQVAGEIYKLAKYKNPQPMVVPIYGGQSIDLQFKLLKRGVQIIVATPGRLMDHMERKTIDLSNLKYAVLDEADEMLKMGFREDMENILKYTPKNRQTIMFSATMDNNIRSIMERFQNNPENINASAEKTNNPKIKQRYFELIERNKTEALIRLLDYHKVNLSIVFCNKKETVDGLVDTLKSRGYFADGLHGDIKQSLRDKVMSRFKTGSTEILVATNVAGRGIDVDSVQAVFNYDLSRDDEDYMHRIGRTGRAGKEGLAFTFVTGRELGHLKALQRTQNLEIERCELPTIGDVEDTRIEQYSKKAESIINGGRIDQYVEKVNKLMGGNLSPLETAGALFKMLVDKERTFDSTVDLNEKDKRSEDRKSGGRSNGGGFNRRSGGGYENRGSRGNERGSFCGNRSGDRNSRRDSNGNRADDNRGYDRGNVNNFNRNRDSDNRGNFNGNRNYENKGNNSGDRNRDSKRGKMRKTTLRISNED